MEKKDTEKITDDKTRRDGSALPPQAALGYSDKRWIVTRLGGTRRRRRRRQVSDLALFWRNSLQLGRLRGQSLRRSGEDTQTDRQTDGGDVT